MGYSAYWANIGAIQKGQKIIDEDLRGDALKKNLGIVCFLILVLTLTACAAESGSRRMENDGDVTMYDSILNRIDSKQNNTSGFNRRQQAEELVEFLKNGITDEMSLEDIVDVFEEMCDIPVEEDMILFETGTFSFTGESLFYFTLVRQFPTDEDDEYYQIEVNVLYKPDNENKAFNEIMWNEDLIGSIFDYVKNSKAYAYAKNEEYVKTDIYLAET